MKTLLVSFVYPMVEPYLNDFFISVNNQTNEKSGLEKDDTTSNQPQSVPLSGQGISQPEHFSSEDNNYPGAEDIAKNNKKSENMPPAQEKIKPVSEEKKTEHNTAEEPPDEGLFAA